MRCSNCGKFMGDGDDVVEDGEGHTLCDQCAISLGLAARCEGCRGVLPMARLCTNERTGRKECAVCYRKWMAEVEGLEYRRRSMASKCIAVATITKGVDWAAYIDGVPGKRHDDEWPEVAKTGAKLPEDVARLIFPGIELPYRP